MITPCCAVALLGTNVAFFICRATGRFPTYHGNNGLPSEVEKSDV